MKKILEVNDTVYLVKAAVRNGYIGDLFTVYIDEHHIRYVRLSNEILAFIEKHKQ